MKREFQIAFLKSAGLAPAHHLMDLGCGTLRGGVPIIEYLDAGHYTGIDVREEVIAEARKEVEEAGVGAKAPNLLVASSLADVSLTQKFEVIWAFSVLIHMSDTVLADALSCVRRHMAPDGSFYANVNLGDRTPGAWQGFPVVWRPLKSYQRACAEAGLEVEVVGTLASLGHNSGNEAGDSQQMLRIRARTHSGSARSRH